MGIEGSGQSGISEIARLTNLGYRVFPLKPNSKIPAIRSFMDDATTDMAQVEKWIEAIPGCNWGVLIPDNVVVLDVDSGSPSQGDAGTVDGIGEFLALACTNELPAGTPICETPRGRHLWFSKPTPERWQSGRFAVGRNVYAICRGYMLIPPSKTNDHQYHWAAPLTVPPGQLPLPHRFIVEAIDERERHASRGRHVVALVKNIRELLNYDGGAIQNLVFECFLDEEGNFMQELWHEFQERLPGLVELNEERQECARMNQRIRQMQAGSDKEAQ